MYVCECVYLRPSCQWSLVQIVVLTYTVRGQRKDHTVGQLCVNELGSASKCVYQRQALMWIEESYLFIYFKWRTRASDSDLGNCSSEGRVGRPNNRRVNETGSF